MEIVLQSVSRVDLRSELATWDTCTCIIYAEFWEKYLWQLLLITFMLCWFQESLPCFSSHLRHEQEICAVLALLGRKEPALSHMLKRMVKECNLQQRQYSVWGVWTAAYHDVDGLSRPQTMKSHTLEDWFIYLLVSGKDLQFLVGWIQREPFPLTVKSEVQYTHNLQFWSQKLVVCKETFHVNPCWVFLKLIHFCTDVCDL